MIGNVSLKTLEMFCRSVCSYWVKTCLSCMNTQCMITLCCWMVEPSRYHCTWIPLTETWRWPGQSIKHGLILIWCVASYKTPLFFQRSLNSSNAISVSVSSKEAHSLFDRRSGFGHRKKALRSTSNPFLLQVWSVENGGCQQNMACLHWGWMFV